jgi:transposase
MHANDAPSHAPLDIAIGIDWADKQHVVCLIDHAGRHALDTLAQSPEAIDEWAAHLAARFPGRSLAVAIEQSRGPLVHALAKYEHLILYPINPKQLARYREALFPAGGKNDPADAQLLAQFLKLHVHELRPQRPDSPATRTLARLAEIRRKLVEERKRLTQQLHSTLKQYFPQALDLFADRPPLLLALLTRWPTLAAVKRGSIATFRTLCRRHGSRHAETQQAWFDTLRAAVPLTQDAAIVEPNACYAQVLAAQIATLNESIDDLDQDIAQRTAQHPDEPIFRSLPGAGDALVPRLIAAFGSDRERYQSAEDVQCASGIAPVTRQSGKTRQVSARYACPKFLKQTFHEFADHARKWSAWSKAYYQHKRQTGSRHQAAVRALAFKWIRIIYHLWKTHSTYDESRYLQQLQRRNSPIAKLLENT